MDYTSDWNKRFIHKEWIVLPGRLVLLGRYPQAGIPAPSPAPGRWGRCFDFTKKFTVVINECGGGINVGSREVKEKWKEGEESEEGKEGTRRGREKGTG